jgi:hypothetical protein
MPRLDFDRCSSHHPLGADWVGNNAAFTCPHHHKVFVVSGQIHKEEGSNKQVGCNKCPVEGCTTTGRVWGGRKSNGYAWLIWNELQ